jgi:hypothetical protein
MKDLIARLRELEAKATPGPFIVERVDHEECITYEVSQDKLNPRFHVIFSEYHHQDSRAGSPKHNAELYAETRNALPKLLDAVETCNEALHEASRLHKQLAEAKEIFGEIIDCAFVEPIGGQDTTDYKAKARAFLEKHK